MFFVTIGNVIRRFFGGIASIVLLGGTGVVLATPMQDLFDGQSIVADDKIFYDWNLEYDVSTIVIDYSQIEVTPLSPSGPNTFDPGLRYEANGQFAVDFFEDVDIGFNYMVGLLDPNWRIVDNDLLIDAYDFAGSGGLITIDEDVFTTGGSLLCSKHAELDNEFGVFQASDHCDFDPQLGLFVEKEILVLSDGDPVELISFEQRFSQIPEPATLLLLSAGLAGVGFARLRTCRVP